jgi:hypothetical protein
MDVAKAICVFRDQANSLGVPFHLKTYPKAKVHGNFTATAGDDKGKLQLIWKGKENYLRMRISHGPRDRPTEFWLDIFEAICPKGTCDDETFKKFIASIDYGFGFFENSIKFKEIP